MLFSVFCSVKKKESDFFIIKVIFVFVFVALSPDDTKLNLRSEFYDESGTLVKGVLVHFKSRRGPKKSVCWKEEKELEDIRYFEMDETERGNSILIIFNKKMAF